MRILIRGTNWVGDAVMSVPAMRMLRAHLPDAHIALLTGAWAKAVFDGAEFLDEVIVLEEDHRSLGGTLRQAGVLRKARFDATILFPNSFHSALLAHLAGIPIRFGFKSGGRGILLTESIPIPDWKDSEHESRLYTELVRAFLDSQEIGRVDGDFNEPRLSVSTRRLDSAREILKAAGVASDKRLVVLGVGSQNSRAKRWQSQGFADLADMMTEKLDASVVILGSEAEKSVADEVVRLSRSRPADLCGKTNLSDAIGVIAAADLYIGNDMGLTHIAPAVGTKTIAIFGPTNEVATRPLSEKAVVIRKKVDCAPCMLRDCPIDHRCMAQITATEVFELAVSSMGVESR